MAQKKLNTLQIRILINEVVQWAQREQEGGKDYEALKQQAHALAKEASDYVVKHPKFFMPTIIGAKIDMHWGEMRIERREMSSKDALNNLSPLLIKRVNEMCAALKEARDSVQTHVRLQHPILPQNGYVTVRSGDHKTAIKALDAIAAAVLSGDGTVAMEQIRVILAGK